MFGDAMRDLLDPRLRGGESVGAVRERAHTRCNGVGPGFVSPLDKNMGALIHLHMGSWIDRTLNRSQTVASTKKGSDQASSSSLMRSRRGQMRQVRQMRGRL